MLQDLQTLSGRLPLRAVLLQRCRDAASWSAASLSALQDEVTILEVLQCQSLQKDVLSMSPNSKQHVNITIRYHYEVLLLQRCRDAASWSAAASNALQDEVNALPATLLHQAMQKEKDMLSM